MTAARPPSDRTLDPQRWLDEHGDYLFAFCVRHVRNLDAAEDLVQETLLAAWSSRDRFSGESAERTWLTSILKHKIIDHIRRAKVRRRGAMSGAVPDASEAAEVAQHPSGDRPASSMPSAAEGLGQVFTEKGFWQHEVAAWPCDPAQLAEDGEFWPIFQVCLDRLPERTAQAFCLREMSQLPAREIGEALGTSEANVWQLLHRARVMLRECIERNWIRKGDHTP